MHSRRLRRRDPFGEISRNFGRASVFTLDMNSETPQDIQRELRGLLSRLPGPIPASNFTARVLQAIELEELRRSRSRFFSWRILVPRAAFGAFVVLAAAWGVHEHTLSIQRRALARNVFEIVQTRPVPSVDALNNFDVIQRMSQPVRADDELLALATEMK